MKESVGASPGERHDDRLIDGARIQVMKNDKQGGMECLNA
jgi:hypothetical protein